MDITELLSELKTLSTVGSIILIGICVLCAVILIGIICESLKFSLGTGICATLALATMGVLIITAIASSGEKSKLDYDLSRDKNYVYLNSHSYNLKSAKLKIIGEDKQTIYVLYKDETYKIPVMVDKR